MIRGIDTPLLEKLRVEVKTTKNFFPIYNAYSQLIGNIVEHKCGKIKYDHQVFQEFKKFPSAMYNEWVLPKLFYGKPVVVVEGVYDCLTLVQAGIPCVAATTNELNKDKVRKLARYTDKVVIWPDSDKHGELGMKRSVKRLEKIKGMQYRVFRCNLAKDCNDLWNDSRNDFETEIIRLKQMIGEMG